MSSLSKNIIYKLGNLDNWSDKVIKKSVFGKLLTFLKGSDNLLPNNKKYFFIILSFLTYLIIGSLCLPQFANDRFVIGILVLFTFIIFVINIFSKNLIHISFNLLDFIILFFLLVAITSTFSSYFLKESLIGLSKYIVLFLFYFIIKITLLNSNKNSFLYLCGFLFFCALAISLVGIYQYIIGVEPLATWEDPNIENIHTRVYSTLGNPNLLAGYLLTILPIGIFLPFEFKFPTLYKTMFLAGCCLTFICLIFTGSRGGYLGLITEIIFGLFVFFFYIFNRRKTANRISTIFICLISLITIFLALWFLFPVVTERISTIFTFREHSSNSYRINVWLSSLKMFKENWLIGIGPGNETFRLTYGLYMVSGFDTLAAYNIFLEIAVEMGILGFITFIFIFIISFLKLLCLFWESGNVLALGMFISLIGLTTHGMVDTVFFRPQVFIPFFLLLAGIAKLESRRLEN